MPEDRDQEEWHNIVAHRRIHELICNYMRGLDRLMPDLVRAVFHDDATTDYGTYKGDRDGFVAFAMGFLKDHLSTHHMLGQCHIDVEGDVAFGEIYFQAHHRTREGVVEKDFFVAGRYIDRYEKRGGIWKIAHRTGLTDWARLEDDADPWRERLSEQSRGARAPADLSCRRDLLRVR